MDRQGFQQFLYTRKLSAEQIKQYIGIVERFEAFLSDAHPPVELTQAGASDVRLFVDVLIQEETNTYDNLIALARYARFIQSSSLYVALLELLDGSEALDGLYRKLGQVVGEKRRAEIFGDIILPPLGVSNWEKARIMRTAIARLECMLDDETRALVFADSFRDLQDEWYLDDKKTYWEYADFDRYLEMKREEFLNQLEQIKDEGGLFFSQEITDEVIEFVRSDPEISQGVRQGNTLYVTKIPYMAKEYLAETDPDRKRYYYCHCPWARESLRQSEGPVSATFCQCSAGFHKKPWEVIFGRRLEVDVLESVLQGDLRCRFAIHLPLDQPVERAAQ